MRPADNPPGLAVVRALAVVVPRWRRAEWLAEWEGELAWAWRSAVRRGDATWRTALALHLRGLGAATDALWFRRHDGMPVMLGLDVKYAARSLRRRPGFTLVAVLTLALGIGATTAMFSVVDGVLLRPLALPEPERLVKVEGMPTDGDEEKVGTAMSLPDYRDFRERARTFAELAAMRGSEVTLTRAGAEPARLDVAYVTDNLFRTLGASPTLGRAFTPDDVRPGAPDVALLSHALWRARFGGDPAVVGRSITLDGRPATIVGVAPPDLGLARSIALWRPLVPAPVDEERGVHRLAVFGRLRTGVSVREAQLEASAIARALEQAHPADNAKRGARVELLRDDIVGPVRPALLVLLAAVVLVLVVGCANLAGLLLARASAREREMAVRAALGAGRGQLLRQWMAESLLITSAGGLAGAGVAWLGMRALLAFAPRTIPRANEVAIDGRVLLFLAGVSVVTGLVFGALPMLRRRGRPGAALALRDGRAATGARGARRTRHVLVAAEVALATVLVSGAGLLLQGLWRLTHAELRFQPERLAVMQVRLPETRYDSAAKVIAFYDRLGEAVAALPGVRGASFAYEHPLSEGWTSSYLIDGRPAPQRGLEPEAYVRPVRPGYFRTVGVPLLRGRDVTAADRFGTPGAAVVNEAFVRRHFAGSSPIGQRLGRMGEWWPGQPTSFEIVGVAADEPFLGPNAPARPAIYYAHAQFPMNDMWLVVRAGSDGELAAVAAAVRTTVRRIDPDLPVEPLRPMRDVIGGVAAEPRFNTYLLSTFAAAALLLAAIGIYGVLSYTVAQRVGEIGVRLALGAERARVVRGVIGEGVAVAALGLAVGVPASIATGRLLAGSLDGVRGADLTVLAAVSATLLAVAALAAWLPARRASRVDPVRALRGE